VNRRWWWIGGGVALVLVLGAAWAARARAAQMLRNAPAWLRGHQPPDGIVTPVEPVPPAWRGCSTPSPMVAPCQGFGAGRRTMRTYSDNLANEPGSLIRGAASFRIGS
jgi:hypothetical protein